MKLSQKWLEKFGGYENENENVNYGKPDFWYQINVAII